MFRMSRLLLALSLSLVAYPHLSQAQSNSTGAVFVMTNGVNNNQVISYKRNADGSLSDRHYYATGGRGSGGVTDPLASQGALTLTDDDRFLLAVNAGTGDISVFQVNGSALTLLGTTPCGGSAPVAVTQKHHLVYVVNAGGASNVTAFHLTSKGLLKQIPNSTTFLTTANSGASSLAFSPDGNTLLVTEKLTNDIDAFPIHPDGRLGSIVVTASAGPGLFGVVFAPNGTVITTETGPTGGNNASAASSYLLNSNGTLSVITASAPTLANATCWHVVTPDGKHVYTSNPGSSSVSGFSIGSNGALTAIDGIVLAILPSGSTNLDVAVTLDGKYIYTIDSGTGAVSALSINADGTVTALPDTSGLNANVGFNGIAAM